MPGFVTRGSVHENVAELRRHLGSATRPLSFADLARVLNDRDGRQRSSSTIQRWEKDGAEPDYESTKLMAQLASVTFEEFALGTRGVRRVAEERPEMYERVTSKGAAGKQGKKTG